MEPSIPDSEFRDRVRNTLRGMEERDLDSLVVFSSYPEREGHVGYLTNYHGAFPTSQHDNAYVGLGYTALLLSRESEPVLFPGALFASGRLVGIGKVIASEDLPLSLADYLVELMAGGERISSIGIAGSDVFPSAFMEEFRTKVTRRNLEVSFVESDSLLVQQRMKKSEAEQHVLRRGAKIADRAILAAHDATKEGARESEIALAALKVAFEEEADYVARTRIYGRNISGVRWPIMTARKLEKGEITGIDFVGWFNSYGFDVLRLWTVGNPTEEQKEFLRDASTLTEETVKRIAPGMTGDELSNATVEFAREKKLKGCVSPFAHAIGLEIVENPLMLPKSDVRLPTGAFLCVEPGLENEKRKESAHFEDEVLVHENGSVETISKCPKILW